MSLWQWSTTPANNATSAPPINWAEGMAPGLVDDSARQMMADVAQWYQSPEWLNYGLTPTYVSGTQFTLAGNQTAIYSVGRRVCAFVTAGKIYGTISASAYTSLTTVTVAWDSSALDSGVSEVDVGLLNPSNPSIPTGTAGTFSTITVGSAASGADIHAAMVNSNTSLYFTLRNADGAVGLYDVTRSLNRLTSDTAGNFIAAGNITANSDERLKTDWAGLPADFIDRLAEITSGTYTRADTGIRQVGVGAQSLQPLMPEAVLEGENGILSVAYGQAALVACVELAKEVVRLRALLESGK